MTFRSKIRNGIPLRARMQVYFVDSLFNRLDSLTGKDNIIIEQAPVDPLTYLPYPGQVGVKDTSFYFNTFRMDRLSTAKKIVVRSVMNSTNEGQELVKIKAAQALDVNFSAIVKVREKLVP